MKKNLRISLTLILMLGGYSSARGSEIDNVEFKNRFEAYKTKQRELPSDARQNAVNFRFVFVGGLVTESSPFYLKENVQALEFAGVPSSQIHLLFPASERSIDDNARELSKHIPTLNPDKKTLILIEHSKGAAELLAATLMNPEITRNATEIFLIQGAFTGSGFIDHALGVGRPINPKVPWTELGCLNFVQQLGKIIPNEGLRSLRTRDARWYWKNILKIKSKEAKEASPKIHYIRSWMRAENSSPALRCITWYTETAYGRTDGVHVFDEQLIPGIGQDLMALENVDHADFMNTQPLSRRDVSFRRALMWTILESVAQGLSSQSP